MFHLGDRESELDFEAVDELVHNRGFTETTGGGTDHDDSIIRARPAFTWEAIWDDPVKKGRWKRHERWQGKLAVWFGITPLWTSTYVTNGVSLDLSLQNGRYVLLKQTEDDEPAKPRMEIS